MNVDAPVPASMLAAVAQGYGAPEVMSIREVATPRPGKGELLVAVRAASVNSGDARIRGSRFPGGFNAIGRLALGVLRPRQPILGVAFSGEVVGLGDQVAGFAVGDRVAGMTGARMGAHAQYVAVQARSAVTRPQAVTHEAAAAVLFGGTTALTFLRDKGQVQQGHRVLVVGAAGAVGTNAVQIANRAGAHVTAVCSGRNADLVRQLGAAAVIDRTVTELRSVTDRFDVVLDAVGGLGPADAQRLLRPGGRLLLLAGTLWQTLSARGPVRAGMAGERAEDFTRLLDLVAAGDLKVVIERALPLGSIVEAHQRVDSGHKIGNIVVLPWTGAPEPGAGAPGGGAGAAGAASAPLAPVTGLKP